MTTNFANLSSVDCMNKKIIYNKPMLVVIFSRSTKTKTKKMMTSVDSLSSSLNAQKHNKKKQKQALVCDRCLFWGIKTKQDKMMTNISWLSFYVGTQKQNKKNDDKLIHCCFLWVHKNKTKKDDDKHRLVIIISRCKETKQEKMTSVDLLLSSLVA